MIAIEAGLAVAFSFLLRPALDLTQRQVPVNQQFMAQIAVYEIPILGMFFAFALARIVIRERKWQSYFVGKLGELPSIDRRLFPEGKGDGRLSVSNQRWGYISRTVALLAAVISAVWAVTIVAIFLR